ncbi:hypothetical protein INS49_012173 [Diaporthe citri]|uniref:uncharacterized protein n=1 Tax=Diaporthe citri TaxID=83186 RepID=UPI001C7E8575|nr:uncharacterized protein INS49_012173 [Diaporthe citri]KAG6358655.1 hypothetical protein INS49_012173 [Diaporthe citri]
MAKLGKPKGSRNKKTLERLMAAPPRPSLARSSFSEPGSSGQPTSRDNDNVDLAILGADPHLDSNDILGACHQDQYTGRGSFYPPLNAKDLWSAVSDPREFIDPELSAEGPSKGDPAGSWVDREWQELLGDVSGDKSAFSHFAYVGLDDMAQSTAEVSGSPTMVLDSDSGASDQVCSCFKRLTDHLQDLNITERQQSIISSDTLLQKSCGVLVFSQGVLACRHCHLDSKILLLLMTVLQTVLNWVYVESKQHKNKTREIPAIYFGTWKVPEAHGHLIQGLLTSQVLAGLQSIVDTLRLRVDEISLGASKAEGMYQYMDAESLRHALQRLVRLLGEVAVVSKP